MKHIHTSLTCGLLASLLVSCGSTEVLTKWQDPSLSTTPIVFTKVLALVISGDQELRHGAEQDLCDQVKRAPCKPAYLAIPDSMLRDVDAVKAIVHKEGFDGALLFRVMGARKSVTYVPPSPGAGFWGYYGAARVAYEPGYYRTDQFVRVETSIYSIREDKLLWVATTDTVNPDSVGDLVKDVAGAVRKELEREGAVPASP
jgi:hypothetical protein